MHLPFTHFYNAIDVIRSRKILSRDRAEELGLLKYDSAGSVVFRSSKAHKFARFYFRPCTPTQYYNEALGADSQLGYYNRRGEWKSKYPKAVGLGLPKCPVPVFFKFDMDEVLAKVPEQCYYSDRNMQSDNPNVYKIIDRPEALGIESLYSTMDDAYIAATSSGGYNREIHLNEMSKVMRYSQQEFLVMSEFDFSEIKSLQIICYDNSYAELLKKSLQMIQYLRRLWNTAMRVFLREKTADLIFRHQKTTFVCQPTSRMNTISTSQARKYLKWSSTCLLAKLSMIQQTNYA